MFENCSQLTSLDLTNFKTQRVVDMSNMFYNCSSLENLKVNFNTENVQYMNKMFGNCSKLSSLDISTFNTEKCTNFKDMFENDDGLNLTLNYKTCSNLKDVLPPYINPHDSSET